MSGRFLMSSLVSDTQYVDVLDACNGTVQESKQARYSMDVRIQCRRRQKLGTLASTVDSRRMDRVG